MRFLALIGLILGVLALLVGCGTPTTPTPTAQGEGQLLFFYTDN
jgi:hypothetical protein